MSTSKPASSGLPLELVVITGLSGAGRSTAAKCLEDLGWFVVDNLPPSLIASVVEHAGRSQGSADRIAVVVDVRSRGFADLRQALEDLDRLGLRARVLFLEASDDVLVRRFDGVRRPHPLQGDRRVVDGIAEERELLADLRGDADLVVDTSVLNIHELRAKITASFGGQGDIGLHLTLLSFGYKYGLPVDADVVLDCRLIPNPHWVPELRPLTGDDEPVREFVFQQAATGPFLQTTTELLREYEVGYVAEGKHYATVAIGCTGGKHRSVALAAELKSRLERPGVDIRIVNRDLGRE